MINTSVECKGQNFVLTFYLNKLWINGRQIKLRSPESLNNREKEIQHELEENGLNKNLAIFTLLVEQELNYEDNLLKWIMINVLYHLYHKRNIVAGNCFISVIDDTEISINGRKTKINKHKLITEGKRIFKYPSV